MKIVWYAEDGYAGHGPHSLRIDDEDLEGLNEKEVDAYIEECVREDFEKTVSFYWERKGEV